jgi:4-aminobutyrate aminotransferase-like enzyme
MNTWISAGVAIGSVGHRHHYTKRLSEQLGCFTFGSFATETRARFQFSRRAAARRHHAYQLFSARLSSASVSPSRLRKLEFVGFWGGYHGKTAGVIGLLGGSYRNHQGPFPTGTHLSPYANCYRCPGIW